jgi:hypothetical protein
MPLITESALLKTSANHISKYSNNPLIMGLFLELNLAGNLAEAYSKTYDSIFWHKADRQTKNRVKATLDDLALKIEAHLKEAIANFNLICEEQERLGTKDEELYRALNFVAYRIKSAHPVVKKTTPSQLSINFLQCDPRQGRFI